MLSWLGANKKKSIAALLAAMIIGLVLFMMIAEKVVPVSWDMHGAINQHDGVAIHGYDAVSYLAGKPQVGSTDHAFEHGGVRWLFASADNLARFQANPDKLAPRYGGFCATAVSDGFKADIEPDHWTVAGETLYLFNGAGAKEAFDADAKTRAAAADSNWAKR